MSEQPLTATRRTPLTQDEEDFIRTYGVTKYDARQVRALIPRLLATLDAARAGVPEQPDESVAWHQSEQARYLGVVEAIHSDGDVCTGIRCGNPEHGWARAGVPGDPACNDPTCSYRAEIELGYWARAGVPGDEQTPQETYRLGYDSGYLDAEKVWIERAGVPGDEGLKARIDAMYLDGHPMDGYSTERRLGWDEAIATVRSFIRDDAARAGVPGDEGLRAALKDIASLYNDNRTRPASFAIQAGEIAVKALNASPAPAGLDVEALTRAWWANVNEPQDGLWEDASESDRENARQWAEAIAREYAALASPDSERPTGVVKDG